MLVQCAQAYASQRQGELGPSLGDGIQGTVFLLESKEESVCSALKIHRQAEAFRCERDVYRRLAEEGVSEICGFHVPQLLAFDDKLLAIEMTVVTRPYILDFAGATLDRPPDFSEDAWQVWEEEKIELYGERWPLVEEALAALKSYGVFMTDASPRNIAFLDLP